MTGDHDDMLNRMRALIGDQDPDSMIGLVHKGAPVSKARARWNMKMKRFYTPADSQNAQEALAWQFRSLMAGRGPFLGPVAIVAIFYRPNFQRIDIDNLMKLVMDAATKANVWKDDCQVAAQMALMEHDPVNPRTVVGLCPYISTMNRANAQHVCKRCGKTFERPAWYLKRNERTGTASYCSGACARPLALQPATCAKCGTSFQRQRAGQRYCSRPCSLTAPKVRRPRADQPPPPTCEKCGGPVSRREYQQCRACRGYGRPTGSKNKTSDVSVEP